MPETTFARLCRLEAEVFEDAANPGGVLALARFELALEATRRPELRAIYDEAGVAFREPARGLMAALGSTDPDRDGRTFIAFSEGILFDSVAGAGNRAAPTREEIRTGLLQLFRRMLKDTAQ